MGRPSKYKPEYCEALVRHMKGGLSFESFAGAIGVHYDTLYAWEKRHAAFSEAKKKGAAASLLWWEQVGKAAMLGQDMVTRDEKGNVIGKVASKSFNATIWIFAMKNRHGWRDRHDVNQTTAATISSNAAPQTDAALNEIRELLKAKECSSMPTPPLSLARSQGLLAHS
jgi:hypothetical protein